MNRQSRSQRIGGRFARFSDSGYDHGSDWEYTSIIVTVCGHADEHCPALPASVRKLHWPLSDSARAEGDEDKFMPVFRACRDDIRQRVRQLL